MTVIAGPYLLGHLLSFALFGTLCVQVYMYHLAFKKDPLYLRAVVYTLFAIEVTFQALETHMAWFSLGEGWGQLTHLFGFTKGSVAFTTLTGLAASIVHGFYAWRIVALSGRKWHRWALPIVVALLSAGQLSMTIYISAFLATNLNAGAAVILKESKDFITSWFILAVAADVIITVGMTTLLVTAKRKTSYSPTANKVGNLIKYTVETGLVTSFGALLVLILFLAFDDQSIYYYLIYYSLGKIYSNTLLATLNSRITFVTSSSQLGTGAEALRMNTRNGMWKDFASASRSPPTSNMDRVEIKTSTVVFNDSENDFQMKADRV